MAKNVYLGVTGLISAIIRVVSGLDVKLTPELGISKAAQAKYGCACMANLRTI